jgi:hypothetical protein
MANGNLGFPMSDGQHTSGETVSFLSVLECLKINGWDVNLPSVVRSIAEVAFDSGLKAAKWDAEPSP